MREKSPHLCRKPSCGLPREGKKKLCTAHLAIAARYVREHTARKRRLGLCQWNGCYHKVKSRAMCAEHIVAARKREQSKTPAVKAHKSRLEKARRQRLVAQGLCRTCGKRKIVKGSTIMCGICRGKDRDRRKR